VCELFKTNTERIAIVNNGLFLYYEILIKPSFAMATKTGYGFSE